MICEECGGDGGWRVNNRGQRIIGVPWPGQVAGWQKCPFCIGGISSCCDTAGSSDRACTDDKEDVG